MLHPFNDILLICTNIANEMKVFEKYGFNFGFSFALVLFWLKFKFNFYILYYLRSVLFLYIQCLTQKVYIDDFN